MHDSSHSDNRQRIPPISHIELPDEIKLPQGCNSISSHVPSFPANGVFKVNSVMGPQGTQGQADFMQEVSSKSGVFLSNLGEFMLSILEKPFDGGLSQQRANGMSIAQETCRNNVLVI